MYRYRKLTMVAAVAALGLALGGCGSSGGGSGGVANGDSSNEMPMPAPTAEDTKQAYDMAVADLATAKAAHMTAEAALAAAADDAARRAAQAAVGTTSTAVTAAETALTAAEMAWKEADPTGYALMQAQMQIASLQDEAEVKKKADDEAAAVKKKADDEAAADLANEKVAADALAAQVTQIDADEDMMVTPVRNSAGDIAGVMVGETKISTVRFAQNRGSLSTNEAKADDEVKFGIKAASGGVMIRHAESYANSSPKLVPSLDMMLKILDTSDLDFDNPDGKPLLVPRLVPNGPATPVVTDEAVANFVSTEGDKTFPAFNQNGVLVDEADAVIVSVPDKEAPDDKRYYIQVGVVQADATDTDLPEGTLLYVELPLVTEDSLTETTRGKVSEFDYLAYGVWAEIDDKDKPTILGNGYLIADPDMMTPADDMPVTGTATFEGQYVSYVQRKGSTGKITAKDGDVEMTANFGRESMQVKLMDQFGDNKPLTLTGSIDGNTFDGTGLKDFKGGRMLSSDGATAKMSGGFYGPKVDEAGGVYDVLGGAKTNPGRVVGAFGGVNTGN